jgi:hypothetical protein
MYFLSVIEIEHLDNNLEYRIDIVGRAHDGAIILQVIDLLKGFHIDLFDPRICHQVLLF